MPLPVRLLRRPLGALGNRALTRIKKTRTDTARIAGLKVNARWMREMLVHDSRDDLAAIRTPVLAITGLKDFQVDPADLDVIEHLVPGGAETHRVADLTHVLRRDSGAPSLNSYRRILREPVDADLLARVTSWLTLHLDATPQAPPSRRRQPRPDRWTKHPRRSPTVGHLRRRAVKARRGRGPKVPPHQVARTADAPAPLRAVDPARLPGRLARNRRAADGEVVPMAFESVRPVKTTR